MPASVKMAASLSEPPGRGTWTSASTRDRSCSTATAVTGTLHSQLFLHLRQNCIRSGTGFRAAGWLCFQHSSVTRDWVFLLVLPSKVPTNMCADHSLTWLMYSGVVMYWV
jgi:hypothetical protein